jgi:hypothetical protein
MFFLLFGVSPADEGVIDERVLDVNKDADRRVNAR